MKTKKLILAAITALAMAFTFSCSGDGNGNGDKGGDDKGGGDGGQTFTDSRDGKKYKYVQIGEQTWMAENLNYKVSGSGACYNNIESNCDTYGMLYDWGTATNICPQGWHLPSIDEWRELISFVGGSAVAGLHLKAIGYNGLDTYGFAAMGGGGYGYSGGFSALGSSHLWSATSGTGNATGQAHFIRISSGGNDSDSSYSNLDGKNVMQSVRCVKD